ncbi:MAG: hypothetical protein HYT10_00670 [Candidatus Levybacteria bacterium]|nr:hypothetical protein [Candidatus Levybacteria bacterium]
MGDLNKFIPIVVLLALFAFAFYWFELRGIDARKNCAKLARDIYFAKSKTIDQNSSDGLQALVESMKTEYEFCLHNKGY